jgi:cell division protein YceG involved in septum cleavage
MTVDEVVTLASIIEREAKLEEEFPNRFKCFPQSH